MGPAALTCPYCGDETPVELPVSCERIAEVTRIRGGSLDDPAETATCSECEAAFYVLYRE